MSKVICTSFASLHSVIGPENSRHPLNQSDAKLRPIGTWSLTFSRAWGRLHVFILSSDWFLAIFTLVLIDSLWYLLWFWLAVVTTLVLVLRQLIEKLSQYHLDYGGRISFRNRYGKLMTGVVLMVMALDMDTGSNCPSSNPAYRNDSNGARAAYLLSVAQGNAVIGAEGGARA